MRYQSRQIDRTDQRSRNDRIKPSMICRPMICRPDRLMICRPDRKPNDPSKAESEAEWRDPGTASASMPHQGGSPTMFPCSMLIQDFLI